MLDTPVTAPTMQLRGTLRQLGGDLFLDQQPSDESEHASIWTTQRRYQLLATPSTQGPIQAQVNCLVTVTGSPSYNVDRQRTFIVLETVSPLASRDQHV